MQGIILEKAMAPHSSTLAWKIPWTEEPGGLQSMGSRRVGHDFTFTFHFHALEKEMATHSSVLAWRIPGTAEPGWLPSVGLHRVRHYWSDLAAAAAAAGKDWRWEEKGTTEDEIVGWHHQLNGHDFEWTSGVGDQQEGLACCGSWDHKESDTTEWLNWTQERIF